jgi:hypothetical protein
MAITFLQQQALGSAPDFNAQTNAIVQEEALYKTNDPTLDTERQNILMSVVRSPATYGFVTTMLADSAWSLTYDAWASDVAGAEGAIRASIGVWFNLLTGFTPMPPPPESPAQDA